MAVTEGTREAAAERAEAEQKALPLTTGLKFLDDQSERRLNYTRRGVPGGSGIQFKIGTTKEIDVSATGEIRVLTWPKSGENYTQVLTEADIPALLTELTTSAVFDGRIRIEKKQIDDTLLSDVFAAEAAPTKNKTLGVEEQLVLDAIHAAPGIMAGAEMAATILRDDLRALRQRYNGYFSFAERDLGNGALVTFSIEPKSPSRMAVTVQPDGTTKINDEVMSIPQIMAYLERGAMVKQKIQAAPKKFNNPQAL